MISKEWTPRKGGVPTPFNFAMRVDTQPYKPQLHASVYTILQHLLQKKFLAFNIT